MCQPWSMASANLDLVRSIYAAWEKGDWHSAEWAHPEIEFVLADGPEPGTVKGLSAMTSGWREFLVAWDGYSVQADEYREVDDERVFVLLHGGRRKTSGVELGLTSGKGANDRDRFQHPGSGHRTRGGVRSDVCLDGPGTEPALRFGCGTVHQAVHQAPQNDENPHVLGGFRSTATGIRTRVSAMRGRRPSPLDDSGAQSVGSRLAKRSERAPLARGSHADGLRRVRSSARLVHRGALSSLARRTRMWRNW